MSDQNALFERTEWVIGAPPQPQRFFDGQRRWFLLIDERVRRLHSGWVERMREIHPDCAGELVIASGEASKSIGEWSRLTGGLLEGGIRRNDAIVAVGGGVTGDLAGFVASTTLRGISLIHVPTTLLAMVDSSIGGKTGINHAQGKNLIGTFHPADRIHVDLGFLSTLPLTEWVNGYAELVKYGFISDPKLLDRLDDAWRQLSGAMETRASAHHSAGDAAPGDDRSTLQIPESMASIVEAAWRIKQDIVVEDAMESGRRMFLNFGHTFAHALENVAGYGRVSHGTAVLVGMVCAMQPCLTPAVSQHVERIMPYLAHSDVCSVLNGIDISRLISAMGRDKKNRSAAIRLILLDAPGQPTIAESVDRSVIEQAWVDGIAQIREFFS